MPLPAAPVAARSITELLEASPVAAGLARKGVARRLERLGIYSVRDLLFHLPRRYDDLSRPVPLRTLRELTPEGPVTSTVTVLDLSIEQGFRRRVQRTVARIGDETGEGEAVWFGRRYIERRLKVGDVVALSGRVELRGWLPRFQNPEFGSAEPDSLHAGRIVPHYRLTEGVTDAWLRQAVREALDLVAGRYPEYLRDAQQEARLSLVPLNRALCDAHYPPQLEARDAAIRRLAFDELLALQVGMVARARRRRASRAEPIAVDDARVRESIGHVERVLDEALRVRLAAAGAAAVEGGDGFSEGEGKGPAAATTSHVRLTEDQLAAINAVRADLADSRPMLRLLQGDVGSGKTAVAALALAWVADAGRQGALLAPTDLLARQHAVTLERLLEPLGHAVTLLTGSLPAAERRRALDILAAPPASAPGFPSAGRVVVGTHALVQETVRFADLALAVIDEQHRFGVAERDALATKGNSVHTLLLTATPIPRTLGQILHADLDVSDLRTPPAGRLRVRTARRRTHELMGSPERPDKGAYPLLAREVRAGRRAFVVVPLVEEDEETGARSAGEVAEGLRVLLPRAAQAQGFALPELQVGVVHGQMKAAERDGVMERFRAGLVQVLVGTTVLEVGVDVPEATVMVILDADRFGVAQLHQLRGRVGRGEAESWCVLVSDSDDEAAAARLGALETRRDGSQLDGFELAEIDLEQRREGELLGLTQSGLPSLRVARLSSTSHRRLSLAARSLAERLVSEEGILGPGWEALAEELRSGWLRRVGAAALLDATAAGD